LNGAAPRAATARMTPSTTDYLGVILAAGKGSRIDPFHTHYPKPMLPIVNRPIIEHQLGQMRSLGIRRVVLVVGHLKEIIQDYFGDGERFGVEIRYVVQKQTLGIAHAVMQLEPVVNRPFLLFLGDIFYVPKKLEAMVELFESGGVSGVLAVKEEPDAGAIQKNFSVSLDDKHFVTKVVEKPRYLVNNLKGCGMYLFAPEIFDAIRQTPRTALRDEYELTTAIQILINDGYRLRAAEVVDWDYNITFAHDLLDCNARYLEQTGETNAVAPGARLHPGVRLQGAVIGAGVVVDPPIAIRNSVLLPGTHVTEAQDLEGCILSPEVKIRCAPPGSAPRDA
jgi:glucose-1-phosphate thymidylyltransferase